MVLYHPVVDAATEAAADRSQAVATAPTAPLILIIEDDALSGELLHDALVSQHYRVTVAPHGRAALRYLRQHRPCLILLDLRLDLFDGRRFAAAYRAEPPPHAPIIVVSAELESERFYQAMEIAAYLEKPFRLEALYALVGRYCSPATSACTA